MRSPVAVHDNPCPNRRHLRKPKPNRRFDIPALATLDAMIGNKTLDSALVHSGSVRLSTIARANPHDDDGPVPAPWLGEIDVDALVKSPWHLRSPTLEDVMCHAFPRIVPRDNGRCIIMTGMSGLTMVALKALSSWLISQHCTFIRTCTY